jgi:hypothetical protein
MKMDRATKPTKLGIRPENIPEELRTLQNWVVWRWEDRDGKWTKPPYQVNGNLAKSNDPATWTSFEDVLQASENGKFDGVGFMLCRPYVGIDLDGCRNKESGVFRDWAKSIITTFNSYAEVSPSGRGAKILLRANYQGQGHHNDRIGLFAKARYFCITGHTLKGCHKIRACQEELEDLIKREWPGENGTKSSTQSQEYQPPIQATKEDLEIFDKASNAQNGEKFLKLWAGEWQGDYPSQSEADAALCSLIAFWTQDPAQIERIVRGSGLYREKWDRADYLGRTIRNILKDRKETYQEPKASAGGAPSMGELREYIDFGINEGQTFTADEICRALAANTREHKKKVYMDLSRLVTEGSIRKELYRHGTFRRVVQIEPFDLAAINGTNAPLSIQLPLELSGLITLKPKQLLQVSGRYDAGKSSFLFQVIADNHEQYRIVHIVSDELSPEEVKDRMLKLGIPIGHPNIKVYPMTPGYEDLIPRDKCIVILDYIRADENPYQIDAQIQRILRNLGEGVCIFGTQKHPNADKPTGGQFAINACHHVVLLDIWKDAFLCKIFRSKSGQRLEGHFKIFSYENPTRRLVSNMDWKSGFIRWDNPRAGKKKADTDPKQQ